MASDTYYVASIGLDEKNQHVMLTTLTLSKSRKPSFTLFEAGGEKKTADILLVDADDPVAVKKWNKYLDTNKDKADICSVLLAEDIPPSSEEDRNFYIKKPLSATLLLTTLEKVVVEKINVDAQAVFAGDSEELSDDAGGDAGMQGKIAALVVDDSLPVRIQMKKALQSISKTVDFAETGEEAEKLITQKKYDIVFLDVILPGVDGYDICKTIKKNPVTKDTPVIMLTSNSSPADRMKGKMAGCDTYLIKPVRHDIFKEVIFEYLDIEM